MKNIVIIFILLLSNMQALKCQNASQTEVSIYNCEVYSSTSVDSRSKLVLPGLNFKINLDAIDSLKSDLIIRDSTFNKAFALYAQQKISQQQYDSISIDYGVPVIEFDSMLYWLISFDTIVINTKAEQLLAFEVKPQTNGLRCLENSFSAAFVYLVNYGVVYYTYPFEQDYYSGTTYEISAVQMGGKISTEDFERLHVIAEAMTVYQGFYRRKFRE